MLNIRLRTMIRKRNYILLLTCLVCTLCGAQELKVIDGGKMVGEFSERIGSDDGSSISVTKNEDNVTVSFSGAESWAGTYLINKGEESLDLTSYKYIQFNVKSVTPITIEKIGFGKAGEKSELVKKLKVDNVWKTVVLELPDSMDEQLALFSVVVVEKCDVQIGGVTYTSALPTNDDALVLVSAEAERLKNVVYVYSEGFETGAPSGYSGENNGASLVVDDKCMESPYRGKYCVKMSVDDSEGWRALFLQVMGKWTNALAPDTKLPDLTAYKRLVFYARTAEKNYVIPSVGFGGETSVFSQEQRNVVYLDVTKKWERFEIDLRGLDKASVNDVMMFSLNEGVLFLDEIRFEK